MSLFEELVNALGGEQDDDENAPAPGEPIPNEPFGTPDVPDSTMPLPVAQDDGREVQNLPITVTGGMAQDQPFGSQYLTEQGFGKPENDYRAGPTYSEMLKAADNDRPIARNMGGDFGDLLGTMRNAFDRAVDRQDVRDSFERSGQSQLIQRDPAGGYGINWNQATREMDAMTPRITPELVDGQFRRVTEIGGAKSAERVDAAGVMGDRPVRTSSGQTVYWNPRTNEAYTMDGQYRGAPITGQAREQLMRAPAPAQGMGGRPGSGGGGSGGGGALGNMLTNYDLGRPLEGAEQARGNATVKGTNIRVQAGDWIHQYEGGIIVERGNTMYVFDPQSSQMIGVLNRGTERVNTGAPPVQNDGGRPATPPVSPTNYGRPDAGDQRLGVGAPPAPYSGVAGINYAIGQGVGAIPGQAARNLQTQADAVGNVGRAAWDYGVAPTPNTMATNVEAGREFMDWYQNVYFPAVGGTIQQAWQAYQREVLQPFGAGVTGRR